MTGLTDARDWLSPADLAGLPGMPGTDRGIRKRAQSDGWKCRERKVGKGYEYHISSLPTETQAAVLLHRRRNESADAASTPSGAGDGRETGRGVSPATGAEGHPSPAFSYSRESLWAAYERATGRAKELAARRLRAIDTALGLIDAGTPCRQAWASAAKAAGFGRATLQYAHKRCSQYERGDWLAALTDRRTGQKAAEKISREAWEYFKADYLRPEQPSAAACYERMKLAGQERGWEFPSLRQVQRLVKTIPHSQRVLLRKGENAMMLKFPPMKRSVAGLHALEWINGDGYLHNVFVRWPDGTIARPKTWFWQDVYSRRILSWRTDQSEHTDVIRQSIGDLIERYGIPHHATLDNTRGAANKWMSGGLPHRYRFTVKPDEPEGLFKTLGIDLHWTTVSNGHGHGQAKPIERQFGVGGVGEFVDRHPALAGAYTGKDTSNKPDNYGDRAIDLADFLEVLAQGIKTINARQGRRTEACGGSLSFDQAFSQSYEKATIRKAAEEQRRLWMLCAEAQRVDRNRCIALDAGGAHGMGKNRYHCDFHGVEPGQKLVSRFDPERLHAGVHIYTLDSRYLGWAECTVTAGFGDSEAGRRFNKARKQWVRAQKAAAQAQHMMTAEEAARLLPDQPDPETPEADVVQPIFKRAAGHDAEPEIDMDEYDKKFSAAVRRFAQKDDWV